MGGKHSPQQRRVYKILRKAILRGEIERGVCSVEGCDSKDTHGHHKDYTKPLDVIWLCSTHHAKLHNPLGKRKPDGFGEKVKKGLTGYKQTAEHTEKIAAKKRGKARSENTKMKISQALLGKSKPKRKLTMS